MSMNHVSEGGGAASGATAATDFSIEDLAHETENPSLFMEKYNFYVENLGFTPPQAIRWANRTVRVDTQVKRAFT